MIQIRPYRHSDFDTICSWWVHSKEIPPLPGMMCERGTFVVEEEGDLLVTLTALMTQTLEVSYLEGACAKPGLSQEFRRVWCEKLFKHVCEYLKSQGYKRVCVLTHLESLAKRYREYGLIPHLMGIYSLGRTL